MMRTVSVQVSQSCQHDDGMEGYDLSRKKVRMVNKKNAVCQTMNEEFKLSNRAKVTDRLLREPARNGFQRKKKNKNVDESENVNNPRRPLRKANTASQLTTSRRARLEKILARENNKPVRSIFETKETCDAASLISEESYYEEFVADDGQDGNSEDDMYENPSIEVVLAETEFFSGSDLLMQKTRQLNPVLGEEMYNDDCLIVEFWALPLLDNGPDRDLRTKRSGLGFTNSLLFRSDASDLSWVYLMQKAKPIVKPDDGGAFLSSPRTQEVDTVCTPTLMMNGRDGRLRLIFSEMDDDDHDYDNDQTKKSKNKNVDALSSFMQIAKTKSTMESEVKLPNATWSHLAVIVTKHNVYLYVNGKPDIAWTCKPGKRVAFNWSPTFFGAQPVYHESQGQIQGSFGFVGFLGGIQIHDRLQTFNTADIEVTKPELPKITAAQWSELQHSKRQDQKPFTTTHPSQDAPIQGRKKNPRSFEQTMTFKEELDLQMAEKRRREQEEADRKAREALEMRQRVEQYNQEREAQRLQALQQRRRLKQEMDRDYEKSLEKKRINALEELERQLRHTGEFTVQRSYVELSKQRSYGQEVKRHARKVNTGTAMDTQNHCSDHHHHHQQQQQQKQPRAELEQQLRQVQEEQFKNRHAELQKQKEYQLQLAKQVEENQRLTMFGHSNYLMSKDEREINANVLHSLAREKTMRDSDQQPIVISRQQLDSILKLLNDE